MEQKNPLEEEFYEAMPIAAVPSFAIPPAATEPAADWADSLEGLGRTALGVTEAGLQDLSHYALVVLKALTGKIARRIYLATFLLTGIVAATAFVSIASSTYAIYSGQLDNPTALMNSKNTGTTILDRNGKVLYQVYGAATKTPVKINAVPKSVINATLAAEDPGFFSEPGISIKGTLRAAWADITHGSAVQGGSTLTQQLVKNTLLTPDRSFIRKAQEVALSLEMEQKYTKNQILEMYFNSIDYGEGSYGIGTAAQTYFHTDVAHLTLAQSAMLAGLPLGPSRFDPAVFPADALARRNYVLDRMEQLGYITVAQQKTAKAEPLVASAQQIQIQAPQFVFYVLDQLRQKYGDDLVEHGGITVTTSLDLDKQNAAQKIVTDHIAMIASHNATNSGLISIDPHTGDIITMVGSADYNNPTWGSVNITTSRLQPGSSWKPFEYLTAFEKGWTGGTVIDDKPISIPNYDGTAYAPKNFDEKYHGTMTIRQALDNSLNIPAVETLQFAGIDATLKTATDMGITGLGDASQYGLSLALGTAEVTPLDMATAYATLANQGVKVTPRAILKVTDRDGKDITQPDTATPQTVMDPRYAYMMTSILSDDNARKNEFGLNSPLKLDRPDAAKTGTTEHFDDDWTIGYTPDLATAVWVGNNDHTPINGLNGIQGAAPIWHDFMEMASAGTPVHDFIEPSGVVTAEVCLSNGGLTTATSGPVANEVYLVGHTPTNKCAGPDPTSSDNPTADQTAVPPSAPSDSSPPGQDQAPSSGQSDQPPTSTDQSKPDQPNPSQ